MALKLCAQCERHVREQDETCRYCGGSTYAKVRVPVSSATRRAMFAGASVIFVAAAEGACASAVYGAPVAPFDAADNVDASEASVPVPDANPVACFENAGEGLRGVPPTAYRDVCTPQDLVDVEAACLFSAHGTKACADWTTAHPACGRCVFGPLSGEPADTTPLGALTPVGAQSIAPSLGSCAALAIGRPDCALPIAKSNLCEIASCSTCSVPTKGACSAHASQHCSTPQSTECQKAIGAAFSRWEKQCQGSNLPSTFTKVATYLCGAPPADAGIADASGD